MYYSWDYKSGNPKVEEVLEIKFNTALKINRSTDMHNIMIRVSRYIEETRNNQEDWT